MHPKRDKRLWYGSYGGCFIADAFSLACDQYYEQYCAATITEAFAEEYAALKTAFASDLFRVVKSGVEGLTLCYAGENVYSILGTALLAKHLGKKKALCGARYADEALLCARICKHLGVSLKLFLSADIAQISTLVTRLTALGAEVDTQTCRELFNLPEMYAFQAWIAAAEGQQLINCRSNVGAWPQTNIAGDFSLEYGEKLLAAAGKGYGRIVVPGVSGSLALSVFTAAEELSAELVCVECDTERDLAEELDSYCGTFTKVMRNRCSDRVLAPALCHLADLGRVTRVDMPQTCSMSGPQPEGAMGPLSLQSLAALDYCAAKEDNVETLCVLRGIRWGTVL